ncbi:unnamed protein product [Kuraishia capsulata CBS 1993]|uniref:ATP synthase subunit f, mitochondrial n=1 Tax=Kuraishia capsulata CBS 1993 TaxID=1382522 RepID=W6MQ43_9ASCO|nr:uncharacterized protein KUCA_T00004776001 [Kuraishia capsulata CBS 1993]CDK28791.1 unnamed protein product [Kuraishia capsulata CBS 1993]
MQQVVSFYKELPQGPASFPKGSGPIGRYTDKYFNGDKASGVPLLHFAIGLVAFGYGTEYYFHLRHHKSGEH